MIAKYRTEFQMYTYDGVTNDPEEGICVKNGATQSVDSSYVDVVYDDGKTKHGVVELCDCEQVSGYPSYGWGFDHGLQHAVYAARHPDDTIPEIQSLTVMGNAPEYTELDARFDAVNSFLDHTANYRTHWDIFANPNKETV